MAAPPATGTREPVTDGAPEAPCLGVLFVHGAGDHGTGSTLIEFGEPLVAWISGWLGRGSRSAGVDSDRAIPGVTQILVREGDQHAPAHSYLRLRPDGEEQPGHTWLLAESHWDEAFTPPGFQQVLLWAIGVVPWTVLTQFIGPLQRRAKLVPPTPIGVGGYLWRVVVAATTALIVSALVFALALLILILSLIPIDAVRSIVGSLQRFASTAVGDLYMVLVSPVQRAALTGAVQRDIDWLRAQGCDRIALIAHSQGGYVSYQALTDPWHRSVELYITFGSGLIRLTESERARRTPALTLALIGTVGALLAVRFAPTALLGEAGIVTKHQAEGLAFTIGALLSGLLIVVLWRYFHEQLQIKDLPTPIPWIDFLTTEDPVMNRRRDGILPRRVVQRRTQNRGSLLADHGSYWQNSDEFVPQVAMAVATLDDGLDLPLAGPKPHLPEVLTLLEDAYHRRHGRVSALRLRGSLTVGVTIAVIGLLMVLRPGELEAVGERLGSALAGLPGFITDLLPSIVLSILPIEGIETLVLGAAVVVLISGIALWVGSRIWNAWSTAATAEELLGRDRTAEANGKDVDTASQGMAFYAWTLVQVIVLAVILVIGPIGIMDGLGRYAGERDQIVQAWARMFTWTLVVGAVAWLLAASASWLKRDGRSWVVGGIALAFAIELVIAILFPGPTNAAVAIPYGLGIGVIGLLIAWLLSPRLHRIVNRVAAAVEIEGEPDGVLDHPASFVDYLGFIGLLIAVLAAAMVFVVPTGKVENLMHLYRAGALLAIVGALCGLALALNTRKFHVPTPGRLARVPRIRVAAAAVSRNAMESSALMRFVGGAATVAGVVTFVVAAGKVIAAGGPFD